MREGGRIADRLRRDADRLELERMEEVAMAANSSPDVPKGPLPNKPCAKCGGEMTILETSGRRVCERGG